MTDAARPLAGLTASELLHAWECAASVTPARRPGAILDATLPDLMCAADQLPVGARDTLLLALRIGTFGGGLSAVADCPSCTQTADVEVDVGALLAGLPAVDLTVIDSTEQLVVDGLQISFRLATTEDVLVAADAPDPRAELANRCLLGRIATEDQVRAVVDRIGLADPATDLQLRLPCPTCQQEWLAPFDVAAFVWTEVAAAAIGILAEVDVLATRYGWSEQAILEMTAARRRAYLELL